jgi:hypothetical protein
MHSPQSPTRTISQPMTLISQLYPALYSRLCLFRLCLLVAPCDIYIDNSLWARSVIPPILKELQFGRLPQCP